MASVEKNSNPDEDPAEILLRLTHPIVLEIIGTTIFLKMVPDEADTTFITHHIQAAQWDNSRCVWTIPHKHDHLEILKTYLGNRLSRLHTPEGMQVNIAERTYQVQNDELLIVKYHGQMLMLFFHYNKALELHIKTMPLKRWNHRYQYWSMPFSDLVLTQIKEIAQKEGLQIQYREE